MKLRHEQASDAPSLARTHVEVFDLRRSWLPRLHAHTTDGSLATVGHEERARWRIERSKVVDLASPVFWKLRRPRRNWPTDFVKSRGHVLEDEIRRIGQLANGECIDDFKGRARVHCEFCLRARESLPTC